MKTGTGGRGEDWIHWKGFVSGEFLTDAVKIARRDFVQRKRKKARDKRGERDPGQTGIQEMGSVETADWNLLDR